MIVPSLEALAVPVDTLEVRDGNPRRSDVDAVVASLEAFGQYKPVVVNRDDRRVIAGRAVLAAARRLEWETVAVAWVDVDDEKARRIELRDNRTSDAATYDDEELLDLLQSLPDLEDTGWAPADLAELAAAVTPEPVGLTDADAAPETPDEQDTISASGEVYLCGEHRVMCGDATNLDDVQRLVDGRTVDAVWTDPPYGVSYEGKTRDRLTIQNDNLDEAALAAFLIDTFRNVAQVLRPGAAFYVCSPSGPLETVFRAALGEAGLRLRQQLVWVKDRFVLGHQDYHQRHESILFGWADGEPVAPPLYDPEHETLLYGWADGAGHDWRGGRKQDTVWQHARPSASRLHPTMKPVALVRRGVEKQHPPGWHGA